MFKLRHYPGARRHYVEAGRLAAYSKRQVAAIWDAVMMAGTDRTDAMIMDRTNAEYELPSVSISQVFKTFSLAVDYSWRAKPIDF